MELGLFRKKGVIFAKSRGVRLFPIGLRSAKS
jgi:hypothetical protein